MNTNLNNYETKQSLQRREQTEQSPTDQDCHRHAPEEFSGGAADGSRAGAAGAEI
jgi:hypothetical protein